MGGGDLNLKKSWHPSTMKNIEKVWKAERQKDQEKKRIEELKREIEMEKDREDLTQYAMDQGVLEKKESKKLDWMYKASHETINREEYLLGRPIDESFERLARAEKEAEGNRVPKNHVEYECIPPSLRSFSGNEQVDLARKAQEDPLYAIKKKEMETRSQLLKNPVKLKQLKELLEQQSKKDKSDKKSKKKKSKHKHKSGDSEDETELDNLLAEKYKRLKKKLDEKDLIKSVRKSKQKKKKRRRDSSEDSESSSDESVNRKKIKKQRNEQIDSMRDVNRDRNKIKEYNEPFDRPKTSGYRPREKQLTSPRHGEDSSYRYDRNPHRRPPTTHSESHSRNSFAPRKTSQLTDEEKERRRREMMSNAAWRDKERERSVKQYRDEEKKELSNQKMGNKEFIRKQLVAAAEVSTVASRIKSNINNIQRSGRAMDTNFAKR